MFVQAQSTLRKSLSGSAVAQVAEALRAAEQCNLSPIAGQMVSEALALLQAAPVGDKPERDKPERDNSARIAFSRLARAAVDAVREEHGAEWHTVPGARINVRVPAEVARYVRKDGKVERGNRDRTLPAPQYWPNGELPAACVAMGDATSNRQRWSGEWRTLEAQHGRKEGKATVHVYLQYRDFGSGQYTRDGAWRVMFYSDGPGAIHYTAEMSRDAARALRDRLAQKLTDSRY